MFLILIFYPFSVVTISFLGVPYEVPENVGNFTVHIGIDRDILRTLTFDVSGGIC